jgi:hypothetical protein
MDPAAVSGSRMLFENFQIFRREGVPRQVFLTGRFGQRLEFLGTKLAKDRRILALLYHGCVRGERIDVSDEVAPKNASDFFVNLPGRVWT